MAGSSKKWVLGAIVLAVLVPLLQPVFPEVVSNYRLFLISTMIIAAIAVLGLNLLTGFNGQFSLGHGAFYAVGAYTAAILMDKLNVPYWATIPAATRADPAACRPRRAARSDRRRRRRRVPPAGSAPTSTRPLIW